MRWLVLTLFVVASGCATLNREECVQGDWQSIGEDDGAKGYQMSRILKHREACVDYAVSPDPVAYERGYELGLVRYCTFRGGYKAGVAGRSYHKLCPEETEAEFLDGYETGRDVYHDRLQWELLYDNRFHRFHHHRHHGYWW